jgi:hypothetical protein
MPVIAVNTLVDKKRIIGKMKGQAGGEAQGVAAPHTHPPQKVRCWYILWLFELIYGHFIYFMATWYICGTFPPFGKMHQYKSGNPGQDEDDDNNSGKSSRSPKRSRHHS